MTAPLAGLEDLLNRLIRSLRTARLDFAFTGAIAVTHYGRPRATADIDIALSIAREDVSRLLKALRAARLAVDEDQIRTTLQTGYPIISLEDSRTPFGVDIILKQTPLRTRTGKLLHHTVPFETPEEIIRTKLRLLRVTRDPLRAEQDKEDVRQLLAYGKVNLGKLRSLAQEDSTLQVLEGLSRSA